MLRRTSQNEVFQLCSILRKIYIISLTDRWKLILDLQDNPFTHILQQTDDLIMTKLCQVDSVYRFYVVPYVQLVTPAKNKNKNKKQEIA